LPDPVKFSPKGGRTMSRLIKILHIDPDYRITYFIFRSRLSIRTSVPLQTAIELLKNEDFDLIVSEPHSKAILKQQHQSLKSNPTMLDEPLIMEADHGDLREVSFNPFL
jgi:hypothetical protein